jgi:hypothetical protein
LLTHTALHHTLFLFFCFILCTAACKPKPSKDQGDGLEQMVCALPPLFVSRFGEICWAQGGVGFGWWPCCIYDPRLTVGQARHEARKNLGKKHLVYFFECYGSPFAIVGNNKIMSWEEGIADDFHMGRAARNQGKLRYGMFQHALSAATIEETKPIFQRLDFNLSASDPLHFLPSPIKSNLSAKKKRKDRKRSRSSGKTSLQLELEPEKKCLVTEVAAVASRAPAPAPARAPAPAPAPPRAPPRALAPAPPRALAPAPVPVRAPAPAEKPVPKAKLNVASRAAAPAPAPAAKPARKAVASKGVVAAPIAKPVRKVILASKSVVYASAAKPAEKPVPKANLNKAAGAVAVVGNSNPAVAPMDVKMVCKIINKGETEEGDKSIGFFILKSRATSTFADARQAMVDEGVPITMNNRFFVPNLGAPMSVKQESSFGPMVPFLEMCAPDTIGNGNFASPVKIFLVEAPV